MSLSVTVLVLMLSILYYYATRTFNYWKNKNVKGPPPIPLFGNIKDVVLRRKLMGLLFSETYKQFPEEKVVGMFHMTNPTLLIRDLDVIKQILIKDFDSFADRGVSYSKEGFAQNIFHSDADTGKFLRNQFSSVFTPSKFKRLFPLIIRHGDRFIDHVEKVTMNQTEQDVYKLLFKYTVATSITAVFGWDVDTFNADTSCFEVIDKNFTVSHLQEMDHLFPGFLTTFDQSLIPKPTREVCSSLLNSCYQQLAYENNDIVNVKDVILNLKKEKYVTMNKVSENGSQLEITDHLLGGQIWVFYIAGYLNNLLSLTYALYHLSANLDVQNQLRKEIDEVIDKHDGKICYKALKEMKYLEMVFKETLRIQPMTQGIIRGATKDVNIDGLDLTIEEGTTVIISPYSIHHDRNIYPEPEKFMPERFSSENSAKMHPCSFLTFGAGRRSCFGSQLARILFGICLAKLLHRFRIEKSTNTCNNITFDPNHMLFKPAEKILLHVIPRNK